VPEVVAVELPDLPDRPQPDRREERQRQQSLGEKGRDAVGILRIAYCMLRIA
jgi:hypothetical protein